METSNNISTDKHQSRRVFLRSLVPGTMVLFAFTHFLSACGNDNKKSEASINDCDDFSNISDAEMRKRENLGYVKQSPIADMTCDKCNLYLRPKQGKSCGTCMLFKGPVYASAYCTYWAAKQETGLNVNQ